MLIWLRSFSTTTVQSSYSLCFFFWAFLCHYGFILTSLFISLQLWKNQTTLKKRVKEDANVLKESLVRDLYIKNMYETLCVLFGVETSINLSHVGFRPTLTFCHMYVSASTMCYECFLAERCVIVLRNSSFISSHAFMIVFQIFSRVLNMLVNWNLEKQNW